MRQPAGIIELLRTAKAISDRTDAEYRAKRRFDRRWLRYKERRYIKPFTGWKVDEHGNYFRLKGEPEAKKELEKAHE